MQRKCLQILKMAWCLTMFHVETTSSAMQRKRLDLSMMTVIENQCCFPKAGLKKRDETYTTYINLLKFYLNFFPKYKLYDLEMVLFSNAEFQCKKALDMV